MKTLISPRTTALLTMILVLGTYRLFITNGYFSFANFTPVGAMALFGGCYFSEKWKAFFIPIITLFLSDLLLNFAYYHEWKIFYNGFLWVYGSFALMVVIGMFIKKVNPKTIIIASVAGALVHWLVSDLGDWIGSSMYPHTAQGFIACYVAAIPFLQNMLVGNLVFGGLMFGIFEVVQRKYPVLQNN